MNCFRGCMPVLLALLGIFGTRASGSEFEVDGIMKATPEGRRAYSCDIQVHVRDGQWAVFQIWADSTNRIVTELSDDGNFVYQFVRAETNSGDFLPEDYARLIPHSSTGQIHPAHFPFDTLNTEAILLFYAYASSDYLDSHTNQMINPIPSQPGDERRNPAGVYALISRSAPPLRLPNQIVFRAEFQPVTNAVFTAASYTNVSGVQIPTQTALKLYLPGGTNVLMTYEFQATRIAGKSPLKSFKPSLPGPALVTDFRTPHFFRNDPGSPRMVTNDWPVLGQD